MHSTIHLFNRKTPSEHGIVGNGWYDRTLNEHHFWKQSNRLVEGEKVWETLRKKVQTLPVPIYFWWYNMYSSVDYSITPRPLYRSDGLKNFDIHSQPLSIRDEIKKDLGEFPFSRFLGPASRDRFIPMDCQAARGLRKNINLILI